MEGFEPSTSQPRTARSLLAELHPDSEKIGSRWRNWTFSLLLVGQPLRLWANRLRVVKASFAITQKNRILESKSNATLLHLVLIVFCLDKKCGNATVKERVCERKKHAPLQSRFHLVGFWWSRLASHQRLRLFRATLIYLSYSTRFVNWVNSESWTDFLYLRFTIHYLRG